MGSVALPSLHIGKLEWTGWSEGVPPVMVPPLTVT